MCGIAGIVHPAEGPPVDELALRRMARAIRHRGPDGWGFVLDHGAGLVSARLAIFDLPGGWQPLEAERRGSVLVYNGEVYNHPGRSRSRGGSPPGAGWSWSATGSGCAPSTTP